MPKLLKLGFLDKLIMDDFDLVTNALRKRYKVTLKFSKHSKERFRERQIDLEELVSGISRLFRTSLGLILYHVNLGDKVGLFISPTLSLVIKGSGLNLTILTVVSGTAIKGAEIFSLIIDEVSSLVPTDNWSTKKNGTGPFGNW